MSNTWLDMTGKIIIVTGGSMGIGQHITEDLLTAGATVVIADKSKNDELSSKENVFHFTCDISKKAEADSLIEETVKKFGKIDGLVNNAAVHGPRLLVDYYNNDPEREASEKDFDFMTSVNLKGAFFCSQAAARIMIGQKSGVIVNISSEAGNEGSLGQSIYSATKGALNAFTLSWAKELGRFNIRVVGVAPGINEPTPMGNAEHVAEFAYARGVKSSDVSPDYQKTLPLGRVGKLDEIADLVTYLLSDRSSYITGTIINITGGKSRG